MKSRHLTSLFRKSGLVLAFSALTSSQLSAADPAAVLPDESVAYMEMDSAGFYKLESNPVVKAIPVEDLKKIFYKLSGNSPDYEEQTKKFLAEETGVSYDELVKKAGRMAVSIHDLKVPSNPTPENIGMEISIAEEFDADEAFMEKYLHAMVKLITKEVERQGKTSGDDLQKFFSKAVEMFEQSTVEHGGAKIHVFKLKDTEETKRVPQFLREWAFCIHDKMILAASGQDQVEEMLDRMKSGGETGSLAASAYYKADHDKTGKALAVASLNLEVILGLVEKYALPLADTDEVDVKKIWKALGADKLRSAVVALSGAADTLDLAALLTYSEKPGLFSVLAIPGSGTPPAFLPKGLSGASYQQIDLTKTLENIEKLATEIYPPAGPAVTMGLQMVQQQTGVDVRKEIIGQLGPDLWSASSVSKDTAKPGDSPRGASFVTMAMGKGIFGIRLKDSKAFALALKTLINKAAQEDAFFEKQEYQGFTINMIKESPEEFRVGYVLNDDWLIVSLGDKEALEQILARLGKSGDDGFFAQKNIARHLEGLRSGQVATSANDIGEALKDLCTKIGGVSGLSGSGDGKVPFDELAKLLHVPLTGVDKVWIDAKHAEYRIRIAPKGE
jgi:hypothetical protein